VDIFEEIVRFHLLSEHELCEEEASSKPTASGIRCSALLGVHAVHLNHAAYCAVTEMEGFNSHLNMEQMNKVTSTGISQRGSSTAHGLLHHNLAMNCAGTDIVERHVRQACGIWQSSSLR
jgi:hypothetical protein